MIQTLRTVRKGGEMTAIERAKIYRTGEGKSTSMMGVNLTLKSGSDVTDGAFAFFEYEAPPGFSGPPHRKHGKMVEAFYVLGGELAVTLDGETVDAGSRSLRAGAAGGRPWLLESWLDPGQVLNRSVSGRVGEIL